METPWTRYYLLKVLSTVYLSTSKEKGHNMSNYTSEQEHFIADIMKKEESWLFFVGNYILIY